MTQTGKRPQLTILDGGRSLPVSAMHRILLDAYVTDTRLMGVLAIAAHWTIVAPGADRDDPDSWEEVYQFIYIDCEEAGFETFQQVRGGDEDISDEADRIENALVCGLGATKVDLDERQLRLLLQHWARFNEKNGLPLPEGRDQYGFLLEANAGGSEKADARNDSDLDIDRDGDADAGRSDDACAGGDGAADAGRSDDADARNDADPDAGAESAAEWEDLMKRICPPITSDLQTVNYFLMRCFGRDYEGAAYLAGTDDLPLDLYHSYVCATFCRNDIDIRRKKRDGSVVYRCESLIEMEGRYEKVISLVTVKDLRVIGLEHVSSFPVSGVEAALILKKAEYIFAYDILLSEDDLEDNIDEFTLGFQTTMSEYENGRLFMRFQPSNSHVNSRTFMLSNDVHGMFFVSDGGQLLVCAHSLDKLYQVNQLIFRSSLWPYLRRLSAAAYCFREPALYEFMNSHFDRFQDFIRDPEKH